MTKVSRWILPLLALFCLLSMASGCSLIGFGIGAAIDAKVPDTTRYSMRGLDSITLGTPVSVITQDSSSLEGIYGGVHEIPERDYRAAYDQSRRKSPIGSLLPALGDSISLVTRTVTGRRGTLEAHFAGFDTSGLRLVLENIRPKAHVQAAFIETLSTKSGRIGGELLRRGLDRGEIPLITRELHVEQTGGNLVSVAVENVLEVKRGNSSVAKFWGLGVGLVIDAGIIAGISTFSIRPDLKGYR